MKRVLSKLLAVVLVLCAFAFSGTAVSATTTIQQQDTAELGRFLSGSTVSVRQKKYTSVDSRDSKNELVVSLNGRTVALREHIIVRSDIAFVGPGGLSIGGNGCLDVEGGISFRDCTLTVSSSTKVPAGISTAQDDMLLDSCKVTVNNTRGEGSIGIDVGGLLTLRDSEVTVVGSGSPGYGIRARDMIINGGTTTVRNTNGSGIALVGGTLTLRDARLAILDRWGLTVNDAGKLKFKDGENLIILDSDEALYNAKLTATHDLIELRVVNEQGKWIKELSVETSWGEGAVAEAWYAVKKDGESIKAGAEGYKTVKVNVTPEDIERGWVKLTLKEA